MTAQEIALQIEEHFGTAWKGTGADGFKAGNRKTSVTGIATAWTPTFDVLRQAVKAKQNMIVAMHGPYWATEGGGGGGGRGRTTSRLTGSVPSAPRPAGRGATQPPALVVESTELYGDKKKFIEDNGLVIWRFNENWQSLPGQYRLRALAAALGWQGKEDAAASELVAPVGAAVYAIPAVSLGDLVGGIKRRQGLRAMRVLGDPAAKIARLALRPGYLLTHDALQLVRDTKVDAVICGESCEWEAFPYFEDWVTAGLGKAFVMLGYAASEDPGAQAMAGWLKQRLPSLNISAVACGEPFQVAKV
jgi:putative NIF3 family GTP cyclohydrolase 1 type 2